MKIDLTTSEASHILSLIDDNEREGWYYGSKLTFQKRQELIKKKMQIIVNQYVSIKDGDSVA